MKNPREGASLMRGAVVRCCYPDCDAKVRTRTASALADELRLRDDNPHNWRLVAFCREHRAAFIEGVDVAVEHCSRRKQGPLRWYLTQSPVRVGRWLVSGYAFERSAS